MFHGLAGSDCRNVMRLLNRDKMMRSLRKVGIATSLVLAGAASVLWVLTSLGWGRCMVWQGPHTSVVISLMRGSLVLQIASVSPDPERPATLGLQRFGGDVKEFSFDPLAD